MKKSFYATALLAYFFSAQINQINASEDTIIQKSNINKLNWIDTYHGISTQIMFDFNNPIYFEKKIIKENIQLKLIFPGMQLEHFSVKQVMTKLSELKKYGIIKNINITEKNKKIPKVVLYIEFAKTKQIKTTENGCDLYSNKPNRLLIKWYKTEDPNRLIIDIFTQEDLDKLKNKNETILFAKNDMFKTDSIQKSSKINRIVLDPGHGGSDTGAKGNGLIEKTVALDIAKKTKAILQTYGFNVLLTRQQDCDLSLAERSTLAEQLKADLFISIHVNSTSNIPSKHSGIETFYLQNSDLITPTRRGGFLFINLKKDYSLINLIDKHIQENTHLSKGLATSIQKSLISYLKSQKIEINNRGVKSDKFRVLLRSPIPSALVEVGFITNKTDALRLSEKDYRDKLAYGICQGVINFAQR